MSNGCSGLWVKRIKAAADTHLCVSVWARLKRSKHGEKSKATATTYREKQRESTRLHNRVPHNGLWVCEIRTYNDSRRAQRPNKLLICVWKYSFWAFQSIRSQTLTDSVELSSSEREQLQIQPLKKMFVCLLFFLSAASAGTSRVNISKSLPGIIQLPTWSFYSPCCTQRRSNHFYNYL